MNIIWVIADTLRRDHVGCYGNEAIITPSLDELAAKATRFDRHYIASFPTMPARADFYAGFWTGCTFPGWAPLPRDMVILPELLRDAGMSTTAVVDTPFYLRNNYNYDRGFYTFYSIPGQPAAPPAGESADVKRSWTCEADRFAPRTFTKAMEWLEGHYKEDFFLYIDAWDPHEPWDPPDYYTELYWPEGGGEVKMPSRAELSIAELPEDKRGSTWVGGRLSTGVTPAEANIRKAHAFYCGEVTMVDTWFGRFIRHLENLGLMDKTMIIFTTDHGTYHGEHGGRFGKHTLAKLPEGVSGLGFGFCPLYEEVVAAPLLVYVPGVSPGSYSGLTSAIDLAPTVLDVLGKEIPDTMEGRSLLPAMKDPSTAGRDHVVSAAPFRSNGSPMRVDDLVFYRTEDSSATITTDDWSMIYSTEPGQSELYSITSDPRQEKNVIGEHPEKAKELHQLLVRFMDEHGVAPELRDPRAKLRM